MSLKKKFYAGVLTTAMVATAAVPALANNHGDTYFNFSFGSGGGASYTDARQKNDDSSGYVKIGGFYGNVLNAQVRIVGGNYAHVKAEEPNLSTSDVGRGIYLSNYVKESGLNSARLKVSTGKSLDGGGVYGVWSPDSI
ncbi:hypothetical protein M3215_00025 [Bacillus cytotoxicus]|uniref:Uncharacterized protein n=1 Tax=Bacillus cytotoxicus TaxID=580165 RepID=A0ACC6A0M3_9BACI|nr:hypothetical protein [Bacillus cytotoxicus]